MSIAIVFLIVSLILAILAAFPVPSPVGLFPLAFAFFIASLLFGHVVLR